MKTDRASFPDRFHIDNAAPQRCVPSFSYIPSLGITAGRCSSAGFLPRQHQDPHDIIVWVLVSCRSREQELLSIIHCGTKLFVCFFNFQMRQNEGNDCIQSEGNHKIHDLQHRDAGFGLDSQRAIKMTCSQQPAGNSGAKRRQVLRPEKCRSTSFHPRAYASSAKYIPSRLRSRRSCRPAKDLTQSSDCSKEQHQGHIAAAHTATSARATVARV